MTHTFSRAGLAFFLMATLVVSGPVWGQSSSDDTNKALDLITVRQLEAHVRFLGGDALLGRDAGDAGLA